jgi:hypothetical protein
MPGNGLDPSSSPEELEDFKEFAIRLTIPFLRSLRVCCNAEPNNGGSIRCKGKRKDSSAGSKIYFDFCI